MFSSAINAVNGGGSAIDTTMNGISSTNKVLSSRTTVNTSKPKVYMGDRYVNGKFMPAGYY